jgi:hypothetical protein
VIYTNISTYCKNCKNRKMYLFPPYYHKYFSSCKILP